MLLHSDTNGEAELVVVNNRGYEGGSDDSSGVYGYIRKVLNYT
jgi:hypothetical protein